jgi:hypothetical protein
MKRKKLHIKGLKRNPPKPSKDHSQRKKSLVEKSSFDWLELRVKQDFPNAIIKENLLPFKASAKLLEFAEEVIDKFVPHGPASRLGKKSLRLVIKTSIQIWNLVVLAEGSKDTLLTRLPELLDKASEEEDDELGPRTMFALIAFHLIDRKIERYSGPDYQFLFHEFDLSMDGGGYHLRVTTLSLEDDLESEE